MRLTILVAFFRSNRIEEYRRAEFSVEFSFSKNQHIDNSQIVHYFSIIHIDNLLYIDTNYFKEVRLGAT